MDYALQQIGILMVGVSDMARSLEFYRDTLGLKVKMESPEFVFLDGGAVTLALSAGLWKATGATTGSTEIVFSVASVRAAHESLQAKGLTFTQEPRVVTGPMWAANFRDPDGHLFSVFGPE